MIGVGPVLVGGHGISVGYTAKEECQTKKNKFRSREELLCCNINDLLVIFRDDKFKKPPLGTEERNTMLIWRSFVVSHQ